MAQNAILPSVKNVVLVHGAFADGSGWSKVIPLLQANGLHVTSVGILLTSFADDVAATKPAISCTAGTRDSCRAFYGGVVITEAGKDPKVASLVYVAAFPPDAGQSITDISKAFPSPQVSTNPCRSRMDSCARAAHRPIQSRSLGLSTFTALDRDSAKRAQFRRISFSPGLHPAGSET